MKKVKHLLSGLPKPIPFAVTVIKIGVALCVGYILIAVVMHFMSFEAEYYMRARTMFKGALEAGSGCLTTAVLSALLCDIIYKRDISGR